MFISEAGFGKFLLLCVALLATGLILSLAVQGCGMDPVVSKADPPISLQELETLCGLPLPCGLPMVCRDRTVTLWGYVDPANIYSRQRFPGMPNEKFRLVDRQRRSIEVWAKAGDNRSIFEKLAQRPSDKIVVTGRLKAVIMPAKGGCVKGVKVLIDESSQIEFR